ncbi:phosphoserine phosphatase serb [Neoconidiobolus thromboides FSU 785]|nr:phosphoserine phosphatase serb [Neoconidiobolus thromboides FSU 785]
MNTSDEIELLRKVNELQSIPIKDREYFLKYGLEINFQKLDVFYRNKRLIVFDMDSTLIKQECIDELAGLYGVKGEVSKITELAMQGQLDFTQSLKARVSLLKGASVDIIEQVKQKIEFTAGALPLCKCLKVLGYQLAVVSGGFLPLAEYVKETLNLDFAFANQLQVSPDGNYLTGELVGDIVSAERKEEILKMLSGKFNLNLKQVMAVGDGANDLLMMKTAGLGVAFNAKSKVQEEAQVCLNQANLLGVLHLLGYTTHDIKELLSITQQ